MLTRYELVLNGDGPAFGILRKQVEKERTDGNLSLNQLELINPQCVAEELKVRSQPGREVSRLARPDRTDVDGSEPAEPVVIDRAGADRLVGRPTR